MQCIGKGRTRDMRDVVSKHVIIAEMFLEYIMVGEQPCNGTGHCRANYRVKHAAINQRIVHKSPRP
jgi:hypothetical protein